MADDPKNLKTTQDNTASIEQALRELARTTVYVGVPAENSKRDDGVTTNVMLGYIHENGSPLHNIPARPFLKPGINDSKDKWISYLKQAGTLAMEGKAAAMDRAFHAAGTTAVASVKKRISAGIPPPLAPMTIARRRGKHKSTTTGTSALGPQFGGHTPLIDTWQLINSITYSIRKGKK